MGLSLKSKKETLTASGVVQPFMLLDCVRIAGDVGTLKGSSYDGGCPVTSVSLVNLCVYW